MKPRQKSREELPRTLQAFLHRVLYRVQLPKKETERIKADFLRLFSFYTEKGLSPTEIEARIGDGILGDFYVPPRPDLWYTLDSAAKVYPLSMTHTRMTMFRVSAYMDSAVVPCVLQVALLSVLKRFPLFATTVRRGVFWHYFDAVRCHFAVREEKTPPCSYISLRQSGTPCFTVQYYKNRVALEVFHALTDGAGAMAFLETLVREYLRLLGADIPISGDIKDIGEATHPQETENAFARAEKQKKGTGFIQRPALQPGAGKRKLQTPRILHFIMPTDALLAAARAEKTTVTCFVTWAIFRALFAQVPFAGPDDVFQVQVPINMRQFYKSETLRNFSLYAVLSIPHKTDNAAEILESVQTQLHAQTKRESLARMLYSANQMATNPVVRIMPLGLKGYVLRKVYGFLGERVISSTLSNLGRVEADFGEHVKMFDFILGAASRTNNKCTLVSYKNTSVLTITEFVRENTFERTLCGILQENGIEVYVEGT